METGTVCAINRTKGVFAVATENGDHSVIELRCECSLEKGDTVSGNLSTLGFETIFNKTKLEEMAVMIQDSGCSAQRLAQHHLMRKA